MSNPNPKYKHLDATKWKPGKSGNPKGKPKGTKHLSKWIQELMNDDKFEYKLKDGSLFVGTPLKAIVTSLIQRCLDGDLKAFDYLARYGYGKYIEYESPNQLLPSPIIGGATKNGDELENTVIVLTRDRYDELNNSIES